MLNAEIGERPAHVAAGVVGALVGPHRLGHTPGEDGAAQERGNRGGLRGRHHQDLGAAGRHVDGAHHRHAAIRADDVGRGRIELPQLVGAGDAGRGVAAGRLVLRAVAVGVGDGRNYAAVGGHPGRHPTLHGAVGGEALGRKHQAQRPHDGLGVDVARALQDMGDDGVAQLTVAVDT